MRHSILSATFSLAIVSALATPAIGDDWAADVSIDSVTLTPSGRNCSAPEDGDLDVSIVVRNDGDDTARDLRVSVWLPAMENYDVSGLTVTCSSGLCSLPTPTSDFCHVVREYSGMVYLHCGYGGDSHVDWWLNTNSELTISLSIADPIDHDSDGAWGLHAQAFSLTPDPDGSDNVYAGTQACCGDPCDDEL